MKLRDSITDFEAQVKYEGTKIPDLFLLYLEEDKWGYAKGDCMCTVTGRQLAAMERDNPKGDGSKIHVYTRRERSGADRARSAERMDESMAALIIDSRSGQRKSLNKIIEERGQPISKVLYLSRTGDQRSYFFKFSDHEGLLQGGMDHFLFNQFNIPLELAYKL